MTLILCLSTSVFFDPGRSMRVFFFFCSHFAQFEGRPVMIYTVIMGRVQYNSLFLKQPLTIDYHSVLKELCIKEDENSKTYSSLATII